MSTTYVMDEAILENTTTSTQSNGKHELDIPGGRLDNNISYQNGDGVISNNEEIVKDKETCGLEGVKSPNSVPEPIAIVGIGLRLPGNIHSTGAFWDLLIQKRETRCLVPESRYNIDGFYDKSKKTGSVASQYGHFLAESDHLDAFDTSFFKMSKAEAEQLDPQQRMILEVVWECMENGGQTGWRDGTQNIGVFLGTFNEVCQNSYLSLL